MSESKELVLVTLPAAADLEAAFISDEYIDRLITDIRQKATSVVGDVNTVKGAVFISAWHQQFAVPKRLLTTPVKHWLLK
jgi:hypothetical protein